MDYGTIQKVVFANCECLAKRRSYMERRLTELGVPDKILRVPAHDAADYRTRFDMAAAAAADGFPEVVNYAHKGSYTDGTKWGGKGDVANAWTTRCVLREVQRTGTCIVMQDDAELVKEFWEYEGLARKAGEFDIIQLISHGWQPGDYEEKVVSRLPTPTVCSFDDRFVHGIRYYGEHLSIYSAEGARKALELLKYQHTALEELPVRMTHSMFRGISPRDVSSLDWGRGARGIEEDYRSHRIEMNKQEVEQTQ